MQAKVITVSDRSFSGARPDESGPYVKALLEDAGYTVGDVLIVPDEEDAIGRALCDAVDVEDIGLIVTTGGTGFAPRDVTPEATAAVCQRMTPGIPEAMRYASMQITPRGMLSRSVAGIRHRSLIVNLPGSPRAAKENLEAVLPALGHAMQMLRGKPMDCGAIKPET